MRMRSALLTATTVLAVAAAPVAATAAPTAATPADSPPQPPGLQHRLDTIAASGALGVVAEVRHRDHVWRGSSGTARLHGAQPVPLRSAVRAGSITKTFTATVVLQLVADGELRLRDSVERWLPGVLPNGDDVTVRELLSHTSGVPDYVATLPLPPRPRFLDVRLRTWTPIQLIDRALAADGHAARAGAFDYSSTNYLLLGMIVERVTGQPYATAVEHRVIDRLGLEHTYLPGTSLRIRGPHPHGYAMIGRGDAARPVDITRMNGSLMWASGEIISTPGDLNRFYDALLDGRLLPRRQLHAMTPPAGTPYGLGLMRQDLDCGVTAFGHDGDSLGYVTWTFVDRAADRQVTVSITPWGPADPEPAVEAMLDAVLC